VKRLLSVHVPCGVLLADVRVVAALSEEREFHSEGTQLCLQRPRQNRELVELRPALRARLERKKQTQQDVPNG